MLNKLHTKRHCTDMFKTKLIIQGDAKNVPTPKIRLHSKTNASLLYAFAVFTWSYNCNYSITLQNFTAITYHYLKWHKRRLNVRFLQLNGLGLYCLCQTSTTLWKKCCRNFCAPLTEALDQTPVSLSVQKVCLVPLHQVSLHFICN